MGVFVMWGVQAYVMKLANTRMTSESIFFYMMLTGAQLAGMCLATTAIYLMAD